MLTLYRFICYLLSCLGKNSRMLTIFLVHLITVEDIYGIKSENNGNFGSAL